MSRPAVCPNAADAGGSCNKSTSPAAIATPGQRSTSIATSGRFSVRARPGTPRSDRSTTVLDSGCCGMAGSFSFTDAFQFRRVRRARCCRKCQAAPDGLIIADGFQLSAADRRARRGRRCTWHKCCRWRDQRTARIGESPPERRYVNRIRQARRGSNRASRVGQGSGSFGSGDGFHHRFRRVTGSPGFTPALAAHHPFGDQGHHHQQRNGNQFQHNGSSV